MCDHPQVPPPKGSVTLLSDVPSLEFWMDFAALTTLRIMKTFLQSYKLKTS